MNPSFGSRERRSPNDVVRVVVLERRSFRVSDRVKGVGPFFFLMRSGIISFMFYSVLRERVERHSQCARGLWVRVDTRRLEDVRKGRASETGQLHGSRGRCPRAREVPALFRNSDSTVSFLSSPSSDDIVRRARTTREETCRRRTLVAACKHVSPASGLARGFSRDRIDRPAIPTTRTTATNATRVAFRPPLFVCTTKCGRHTDVCRTSH